MAADHRPCPDSGSDGIFADFQLGAPHSSRAADRLADQHILQQAFRDVRFFKVAATTAKAVAVALVEQQLMRTSSVAGSGLTSLASSTRQGIVVVPVERPPSNVVRSNLTESILGP